MGVSAARIRLGPAFATKLLALLLLALPVVVKAQDFTYMINNGTIILLKYNGSGSSVAIPDSIDGIAVTAIGSYAFGQCFNLTNVTIPDSISVIGERAFEWCSSLASLTIPNSVYSIDAFAFSYCSSLTNIRIPSSVTNIGDRAFFFCSKLAAISVEALNSDYAASEGVLFNKSLTTLLQYPGGKAGSYVIPDSVTSIREQAFSGCSRLTSVVIPDSVASIGEQAFYVCDSLAAITVDALNSVYYSMDGVLFSKSHRMLFQYPSGNAERRYAIPNGITTIGNWALAGCSNLTNITIPNSVTSIGVCAFFTCNGLISVMIPDSVNSIGIGAFISCSSLVDVTIPNKVTNVEARTFSGCSSLTSVTIGNSVTNIGPVAFCCCYNLTSVSMGNSVTSIGNGAFELCTSLRKVYFAGNAPSVNESLFNYDRHVTVYYLAGTTGWGPKFAGRPTEVWTARVQTSDGSLGIHTNGFGFNFTGASNLLILVEACTNLNNPTWFPLQTNTLNFDSFYFSDLQWTNYPARFYRLRSP